MSEKASAPETPKEFQPIEDSAEADHLLKESAKSFASAMIWTKDQGHVLRTNVSRHVSGERLLGVRTPKGFDPRAFQQALSQAGTNDCYFSISLAWANVFFKAPFTGTDADGLRFRIPERIFKVQRRKDLRFRIPEGHTHKVQFLDPTVPGAVVEKRIFDISASGLAFIVAREEEESYPSELNLKNVTFQVAGRAISVEGQVKHRKQVTVLGKPMIKIGVVFTAIRPGDSQKIASYVFEESRKYFLRFV